MALGVPSRYWPRIGKKVQLVPTERGAVVEQFRAVLESYGFDWSGLQADHVEDLNYGGPDSPQNLWPMDASANMSAGNRQNNQEVTYRDPGAQPQRTRAGGLVGRWFVIISVET
jgi:hypothetical protein